MVCHTDIASVARRPGMTDTATSGEVTGLTEGPNGITVAGITSCATVNVPVSVPAPLTVPALHIVLAAALSSGGVTLRLSSVRTGQGPSPLTLTGGAAQPGV